jgi:hypothetical protein
MAETRSAKRHKWRLPCEIVFEGGRQRSFVIDLSESGLFVQTGAKLRPGSQVEVHLAIESMGAPILLRARVARTKQVPAQLTSVAHGGVGLQLLDVPTAWIDAVRRLSSGTSLRGSASAASTPPSPRIALERFRVRIKQSDGPRSRTLELRAESADHARTLALREAGAGWEAVAADRIAS